MSEYHTKRAAEILQSIRYATIATVTEDGNPWNSPVAHELDDDLTIYWVSDKENQHSKNVRANGKAFVVIYDSTVPEGDGEGVYLEVDVAQRNSQSVVKGKLEEVIEKYLTTRNVYSFNNALMGISQEIYPRLQCNQRKSGCTLI